MEWTFETSSRKQVKVRRLSKGDREGLLNFFVALSPQGVEWGMPPYNKEVVDRWICNFENMIALLAVHGESVVGYSMITKSTHPRRIGVGDLAIYVHQDFQNDGLGTTMLGHAIALAKKEGLHRISAHVIRDNKVAVRLYEKHGFRKEGLLKESYLGVDKKYHDEFVMGLVFSG